MPAARKRTRRLLAAAGGALALVAPWTALAAPPAQGEIVEKQADLKELRARIEELRKEISSAEGSRAEVADQLKDSERSISHLQRELRELGEEKGDLQSSLRELGQQSKTLEAQLAAQQAQLERLLYNQYLRGTPDSLQLLLNGNDPNQVARDLYYLGAVAKARSELLAQIDANLKKKQALAASTRERAAALAMVEEKQKERHEKLLAQREQKKATLSKISAQIAAQKKAVGNLQRDEKRMTQLISRLTKLIAAQSQPKRAPVPGTTRATPAPAAPGIENEHLPQAAPAGSFARLRGNLRLPVKGTVANRFGSARQEGSSWKGLFIRSPGGSEVKAIAGGRVVFAEWLRGFGNLLIIDHGDAYLSIYGNNDALLKNVGDAVRGGDTVATVGNSGGNPESGLYFEIRHQGQPVDPLKWASLK
ncbi:murein hydrolase activator EnvC family protein [Azospira restricta]|uniref:murein hydrolase activator EnvC family protein n=1 Tax=Azospira restricta TaxID=404405 RepID=UPI001EF053C2|nr:peptidoglycan DD-metalloendopeptidase family protein [Azospira restricta]